MRPTTNGAIERERARFDRAQEMIAAGRAEEARRLWWWPRDEEPPKTHWSRVPLPACSCGKRSPDGLCGLCVYCKGATDSTPTAIPRR